MGENQQGIFPTDQSHRDAVMDEFVKVCFASGEYMAQHLEMRLWDAGEAGQQLEQYLHDQKASTGTTPKLKP